MLTIGMTLAALAVISNIAFIVVLGVRKWQVRQFRKEWGYDFVPYGEVPRLARWLAWRTGGITMRLVKFDVFIAAVMVIMAIASFNAVTALTLIVTAVIVFLMAVGMRYLVY